MYKIMDFISGLPLLESDFYTRKKNPDAWIFLLQESAHDCLDSGIDWVPICTARVSDPQCLPFFVDCIMAATEDKQLLEIPEFIERLTSGKFFTKDGKRLAFAALSDNLFRVLAVEHRSVASSQVQDLSSMLQYVEYQESNIGLGFTRKICAQVADYGYKYLMPQFCSLISMTGILTASGQSWRPSMIADERARNMLVDVLRSEFAKHEFNRGFRSVNASPKYITIEIVDHSIIYRGDFTNKAEAENLLFNHMSQHAKTVPDSVTSSRSELHQSQEAFITTLGEVIWHGILILAEPGPYTLVQVSGKKLVNTFHSRDFTGVLNVSTSILQPKVDAVFGLGAYDANMGRGATWEPVFYTTKYGWFEYGEDSTDLFLLES